MPLAHLLTPRKVDLVEGFPVRRVLPAATQRSVGPFVFFDHFGPSKLPGGLDSDVPPHPHIGLATATYLFEGELVHRDSLGSVQPILPGDLNWMVAGSGIQHSERTPQHLRGRDRTLHGIQLWVALPFEAEQTCPTFQHVVAAALPKTEVDGASVTVLIGSAFGATSPVRTFYRTLYLVVEHPSAATATMPATEEELAVFAPTASLCIDGENVPPSTMALLEPRVPARIHASAGTRYVVIGGARPEPPVHLFWNFVSADKKRLAEAASSWTRGEFPNIPCEKGGMTMPDFHEN